MDKSPHQLLASRLAGLFSELSQVVAIALGGSQTGGSTDSASDIDLYVYTRADIPLADRQALVERSGGASKADLGLTYWGPGDEWFDAASGIEADIVYFDAAWMEGQIQRVLGEHQASQGYTTCFWYTILHSQVLFDPSGWLQELQAYCRQDYPEALRQNIIALNYPVLRQIIPAYAHQVEKAVRRRDLVSINHRLAALLASYFDLLLAFNRLPHPGEKRLATYALAHCKQLPDGFESDLEAVLRNAGAEIEQLPGHLTRLLDHLDDLLESYDPDIARPDS
jgi:hypothetical protein